MTKLFNYFKSSDKPEKEKSLLGTTVPKTILESCKDHLNKASSTRINGYWMSILFTICVLCCIGVEIASSIVSITKGDTYSVSAQLITICVLILGQQALLFNLKRKSEDTSFPTVEALNKKEEKKKEEDLEE